MTGTPELVVEQSGGCLHASIEVKPHIPVTLVCADTHRPALAERAINHCLKQCTFDDVVFLTNDEGRKHARKIETLNGVEGYSNLMIRELDKYVTKSSHALVVQWDGYVLNTEAWTDEFLKYDYIGSPWQENFTHMSGGNGGFSLRSKKLLHLLATRPFSDPHPEDIYICYWHAEKLKQCGIRFAPREVAQQFSYEGRRFEKDSDWHSQQNPWSGQFGFHSLLTPLPDTAERPTIFHHSGHLGDIIYALPVMKLLGGGVLYLSPENHYPFPGKNRYAPDQSIVDNLAPFLEQQNYVWRVLYTPGFPHSSDFDLNSFRKFWRQPNEHFWSSIFQLHLKAFDLQYPENHPWLTVNDPVTIPGRPIVVNRTDRYLTHQFNFWELIQKHHEQMVFIGTQQEYELFKGLCLPAQVPYHPTKNLLDVARVIAGAKVFVGNQSCPMAIAMGLGKNIVQEVWHQHASCVLKRDNVIYARRGSVDIPKEWLA